MWRNLLFWVWRKWEGKRSRDAPGSLPMGTAAQGPPLEAGDVGVALQPPKL